MDINDAARLFSALGHPVRLGVLRLLVRMAPFGARPTEIAAQLSLKQNTLSHYLSELEAVGAIRSERRGRSLYYAPVIERLGAVSDYLVSDCCRGRPDLCAAPSDGGPVDVLFVCTSNASRSVMAEAILKDLGQGRFRVVSAGQLPVDAVNPLAARTLETAGHLAQPCAPKAISDFAASSFDLVITVCDNAARCEVGAWPSQPVCAHWSIPSPSELGGDATAYRQTYDTLRHKIEALTALPFEHLSPLERQSAVDRIALDIV